MKGYISTVVILLRPIGFFVANRLFLEKQSPETVL